VHQPDAVLLDLGLPTMDGFETARRLRQEGLGKLLVAVTGFGGAEDRRRATEAGFDTHLTKPVSPDRLLAQVRRVLSSARPDGSAPVAPATEGAPVADLVLYVSAGSRASGARHDRA